MCGGLRPQLPRGADVIAPSLIGELARRLPAATTILSGAGISTESGLADYRSPGKVGRRKPISHEEFVRSAQVRQRYWARSFAGYAVVSRAKRNAAHSAISGLCARGFSHITQNVDGLAAGLELHGTIHTVVCRCCGSRMPRAALQRILEAANAEVGEQAAMRPDGDAVLCDEAVKSFEVPRCGVCQADALMPDLVFHGGSVAKAVAERAERMVDESRGLLVVGSTVTTWSAFRLVQRAKRNGAFVGCMNFGDTRADALFDVKLCGLVGDGLEALAAALLPRAQRDAPVAWRSAWHRV